MDDALSATFGALADPTRRAILERLRQGEATVSELAQPFRMSQPAVSKHLKVLERAGLITRGRDAQRRPARLAAAALHDAHGWTDAFRRSWEQRLDALDDVLQDLQHPDDAQEARDDQQH